MSTTKFPDPIIGLLGAPGSGKTHLAGTLIPQFREAVKAKKPHVPTVKVDDVWWLQFDRAGSDTLRSYGVEPAIKDVSVPPTALVNLFEGSSSVAAASLNEKRLAWLRRVSAIVTELRDEAKAGRCRLVVVDSMTAFTNMVTDSFLAEEMIVDKFDRYRAYRQANAAIGQIVNVLRAIPVPQLWLLHTRTAYTQDTVEQQEDAARRPLKHTIEIDVQRGVQKAIEPVPSLMLGAKLESDQRGNVSYHLVTKPDGTYPIKNRWAVRMPNDTVPDLQRIWDIIVAATAAE